MFPFVRPSGFGGQGFFFLFLFLKRGSKALSIVACSVKLKSVLAGSHTTN